MVMNHLRIRNHAKIRPLNILKDKLDYLQKITTGKYLTDKTKHNLIKKITGYSPCCLCLGIPSVELSFRVGTKSKEDSVRVLEYYCNSCLQTVFEREKQEPNKDEIPAYYGCVIGSIHSKVERLRVSA